MMFKLSTLLLASSAIATPRNVDKRQSCPNIHVFGARETTAPAGFGTAGTVVDLILNAHPGATSEAIDYPATGDDSYGSSVQQGVQAVTNQVTSFVNNCPDTQIVLVGYSQVWCSLLHTSLIGQRLTRICYAGRPDHRQLHVQRWRPKHGNHGYRRPHPQRHRLPCQGHDLDGESSSYTRCSLQRGDFDCGWCMCT